MIEFEKKVFDVNNYKINTDLLNADIIEGIKKLFLHKKVQITIEDEYIEDEESSVEDKEDATQFILDRPAFAAELLSHIESYQKNKEDVITCKS